MEESDRIVWKRLAAEVIYEDPSGMHISSSEFHRLPSDVGYLDAERAGNMLILRSQSSCRQQGNKYQRPCQIERNRMFDL